MPFGITASNHALAAAPAVLNPVLPSHEVRNVAQEGLFDDVLLEDDWLTLMYMRPVRDRTPRRPALLNGSVGDDLLHRIGLTTRADWHPTRLQQVFVKTYRAVCAERSNDAHNVWPLRYPRR